MQNVQKQNKNMKLFVCKANATYVYFIINCNKTET